MTPRPGDYGVVDIRRGGLACRLTSAVIRLGTRAPWSHAFVVVDDSTIVEATPRGARKAPLSSYRGLTTAYNDLEPRTAAQRSAITAAAVAMVGTRYGFLDIAALAFVCLGMRWRWLERRVAREDRLICSQLVAKSYAAAGLFLFDDRPSQAVTPADLGLRLATRPWET